MAPAAARTISDFLKDTETSPSDYDLILTGDLGFTGSELLYEILKKENNIDLKPYHNDCGKMIFANDDTHSGGSGCGCSGAVWACDILENVRSGVLHSVLLVGTGALMNTMAVSQGQTIPGIAHAVHIVGRAAAER